MLRRLELWSGGLAALLGLAALVYILIWRRYGYAVSVGVPNAAGGMTMQMLYGQPETLLQYGLSVSETITLAALTLGSVCCLGAAWWHAAHPTRKRWLALAGASLLLVAGAIAYAWPILIEIVVLAELSPLLGKGFGLFQRLLLALTFTPAALCAVVAACSGWQRGRRAPGSQ